MTAISPTAETPAHWPGIDHAKLAWKTIAILMLIGLWSDAASVDSSRACKPFTFGLSAFGSCDYFAPAPLPH
jgi:hypothetical protein